MPRDKDDLQPCTVLAGWQGLTAEIPENWNIGAISGDHSAGYVRYDDERMPRLEIKWSVPKGFVALDEVISKYLKDIQKGRKKGSQEVVVDRDIKLLSKRKRKKSSLKCFAWSAEVQGHGAAWTCTDCGRTVIAQVMHENSVPPERAREEAGSVLLSIEDHARDGWAHWSAYGLTCRVPEDFQLAGQKLMAGLIELEFTRDTERVKIARWGMASVALKKLSLMDWVGAEMGKELRKNDVGRNEAQVKGHEGLHLEGGGGQGIHAIRSFWAHCTGRLYADRTVGRIWHCEPENKIFYVDTFVDREHTDLADQIAERIQCHPGVGDGDGQR